MAEKVADIYGEMDLRDKMWKTKMAGAQRSTNRMGVALKRLAGIAAGVLSARAVIGGIRKSISAYAEQESATRSLAAAIGIQGKSIADLLPGLEKFSSEMQKQTRFGDEAIQQQMAFGLNLGVTTDQIEDATTAAAGLAAKYGLDLKTAMMLVGRASQGQTQMLTRYGITLDEGLTSQEKFNQLLKIGAANFSLAQEDAKTLSGQYDQMRNAMGDVGEGLGSLFIDLFNVGGMMAKVRDWAAKTADRLKDMADAGVFKRWAVTIKAVAQGIILDFKIAWDTISEYVGTALFNAATYAQTVWKNATDNIGTWMAKMWAKATGQAWALGDGMGKGLLDGLEGKLVDVNFEEIAKRYAGARAKITKDQNDALDKIRSDSLAKEVQAAFEGAKAVDDAEKKKRAAKSATLSFESVVEEAQKYALADAGGAGPAAAKAGERGAAGIPGVGGVAQRAGWNKSTVSRLLELTEMMVGYLKEAAAPAVG